MSLINRGNEKLIHIPKVLERIRNVWSQRNVAIWHLPPKIPKTEEFFSNISTRKSYRQPISDCNVVDDPIENNFEKKEKIRAGCDTLWQKKHLEQKVGRVDWMT